jgi:hypothetical protein
MSNPETATTYYYLSLPVGDKHITVCTLDKLNWAQTLVPIRSMMRMHDQNLLPTSDVDAKLHPTMSTGFIPPPKTVVQVTLPPALQQSCVMMRTVLGINRSGVPHADYNPHITFNSEQEAQQFLAQQDKVSLNRLALINAKEKREMFSVPFRPPRAAPTWCPSFLQHLSQTNDWLF